MSEAARKDVFSCEEFTLYPDGRLDSAPEVERALWRATLNINDRGDSEARLDLALALLQLAEHAAGYRSNTPEDLLARLSDTLGKMLIPALSVGPRLEIKPDGKTLYDSPRSRLDTSKLEAESAAASAKNAITAIKSAMLAIARWKNHRPEPGRELGMGDAANSQGDFSRDSRATDEGRDPRAHGNRRLAHQIEGRRRAMV